MPIYKDPAPGQILICDFNRSFIPPEMIKPRPVVVISPRLRGRGKLCTVVPLSKTPPQHRKHYHMFFEFINPLPPPYDSVGNWVKGDMIYTVSWERLNKPHTKDRNGRQYKTIILEDDIFKDIQKCILCGLGLNNLTKHI